MNQNDKANLATNSLLLAVNCLALRMGEYRSTGWGNCELNLKSKIQLGVHLLFPEVELITSWFMGLAFFQWYKLSLFVSAHVRHIKACQRRRGRSVKVKWVHLSLQLPVEYKTNQNHKLTSRGYSILYIYCSLSLFNSAASIRTIITMNAATHQYVNNKVISSVVFHFFWPRQNFNIQSRQFQSQTLWALKKKLRRLWEKHEVTWSIMLPWSQFVSCGLQFSLVFFNFFFSLFTYLANWH